ncbi:MAG TPA: 50S ribosomal protein L29 [Steroidobacteraceae bacterium]|jgi:large subunit ribosomal protein L29|nr:50S ribosomal protein L29 [Steroidobacteraceae bacterium]
MTEKIRRIVEAMRKKEPAESRADLIKLRREQFSLRMQASSGQTVKSSDFGKAKRNIARLKTVEREKQLAVAKVAGAKK